MSGVYIGVDPGKNGGLAILHPIATHTEGIVMPMAGKLVDTVAVADWLYGALTAVPFTQPAYAAIEEVGARPDQGVVSMFNFGKVYGQVIAVFQVLRIPFTLVKPQQWKKQILRGTDRSKDAAITYVRSKYPTINLTPGRARKPHDGIAEAVCLAEYARLDHAGETNKPRELYV